LTHTHTHLHIYIYTYKYTYTHTCSSAILFWEVWARDIPWEGKEIPQIKAEVQRDVRPDHYACREVSECGGFVCCGVV
jgi:hypothetical protein